MLHFFRLGFLLLLTPLLAAQSTHLSLTSRFEPAQAKPGDQIELMIEVEVASGFYIYGSREGISSTRLELLETGGLRERALATVPEGQRYEVQRAVSYRLEGKFEITQAFEVPADARESFEVTGQVSYVVGGVSSKREKAPFTVKLTLEGGESDSVDKKESPWITTPTVSSDPKVATSGGALVAYRYSFDEKSPTSLFGAVGAYSTTDSYYYGLFAKTYFKEDAHRVTIAAMHGVIRNDYEDFLGTGLPAQTTDDMRMLAGRYYKQISGPWYLGVQAVSTNYVISGSNDYSSGIVDAAGLTGFDSNALGLAVTYDTKDNQNSPLKGLAFQVHNLAFRKSFGGDASFDALHADAQYFLSHGEGSTTAFQIKGRWTNNAPASGYSSVDLRGYVRGQYLAEHMSLVEVDERFAINEKWNVAAFAGVALLYGDGSRAKTKDNVYPGVGVGTFYHLTEDRMLVRADFAFGESGNYGFYLNFGQPF